MRWPVVIAALLIVGAGAGWLLLGDAIELDGFITNGEVGGPDHGFEDAVGAEMTGIYMQGIPSARGQVIFCAPRLVRPDSELYEAAKQTGAFRSALEGGYEEYKGTRAKYNIVTFASYSEITNRTWKVSAVNSEEYFTCPPNYIVAHSAATTYALPYEQVESRVREQKREEARRTGGGRGLFGIFGFLSPKADVLFCKPYLWKTTGDLDAVLDNQDFKESLEEGYRDIFPKGVSFRYDIVLINGDADIAAQTLRGERLAYSGMRARTEMHFRCPPTHRPYHRMRIDYNEPSL